MPLCRGGDGPAVKKLILGGGTGRLATSPESVLRYLTPAEYCGYCSSSLSAKSARSFCRFSSTKWAVPWHTASCMRTQQCEHQRVVGSSLHPAASALAQSDLRRNLPAEQAMEAETVRYQKQRPSPGTSRRSLPGGIFLVVGTRLLQASSLASLRKWFGLDVQIKSRHRGTKVKLWGITSWSCLFLFLYAPDIDARDGRDSFQFRSDCTYST